MKSWWWLLGVSLVLMGACRERGNSVLPEDARHEKVVQAQDTGHGSPAVQVADTIKAEPESKENPPVAETKMQDTTKRYPIIHIGDKDFDPNRYLGPDATDAQRKYAKKMIAEDSLRRTKK